MQKNNKKQMMEIKTKYFLQLTDYRKNINQVLNTCINIQNQAIALDAVAIDMELLAKNGVIQSCRLGRTRGLPLVTLAGFLSELPRKIAPELSAIEASCTSLARLMALCANQVRMFYQYINGLVSTLAASQEHTPSTNSKVAWQDINFLQVQGLQNFNDIHETFNFSAIVTYNLQYIANRSIANINSLTENLNQGREQIRIILHQLTQIRMINLTSHYLGISIAVEASGLGNSKNNFMNLVEVVNAMSKDLDNRLTKLELDIDQCIKLTKELNIQLGAYEK